MKLGGASIDKICFDKIRQILPHGTILELGSGVGTGELSKHYEMYSIEHDKKYMDKYTSTYIHAPIVDGWYDTDVLKRELPGKYDLILIDGPLATVHRDIRNGFLANIKLFNTDVPMIFDDVHRSAEMDMAIEVSELVCRHCAIYEGHDKSFAVV